MNSEKNVTNFEKLESQSASKSQQTNFGTKSKSILEVYAYQLKLNLSETIDGTPIDLPSNILVNKIKGVNRYDKVDGEFIKRDSIKHIEVTGLDENLVKILEKLNQPLSSLRAFIILLDATPENESLIKTCNEGTILSISDYYATAKIVNNGKFHNLAFDLRARNAKIVNSPSSSGGNQNG